MCGIAGFVSFSLNSFSLDQAEKILVEMSHEIKHRGPNSHGVWFDEKNGVGLAHRRLAILDLSKAGHQPMHSSSGRFIISFNGEIYNHLELRNKIESQNNTINWNGKSDTETLLACFEVWGIDKTIEQSVGMFSIAVWDSKESEVFLIRDRLGEKPLYYGWQNNVFIFGSELKALKAHPNFNKKVSVEALSLYIKHNYIPTPYCIWEGISKLLPGHIIKLNIRSKKITDLAYWSAKSIIENCLENQSLETKHEIVEKTEEILKDAVGRQMMSDVPLGAFLSGGIDSSLIVALMQDQSDIPIKTFTIGLFDKQYNEAEYAKAVANYIGTDHTELYVSPEQALDAIKQIVSLYDEPFADSSQIPTFLVCQMAKKSVTVSLTGDGADEIFCGYNRYKMSDLAWKKISILPMFFRKIISKSINIFTPLQLNILLAPIKFLFLHGPSVNIGDKVYKIANIITSKDEAELYRRLVSTWENPSEIVLNYKEPAYLLNSESLKAKCDNPINSMMANDMMTYLTDDILVKVDRAAMGVSLETRAPYLDHNVVEHAWRIPLKYKLNNGKTKWVLREILQKYVPDKLIDRPKTGFGIPIDDWLRGPLKKWVSELLNEKRIINDGYFKPGMVTNIWNKHLKGSNNYGEKIWSIIIFQLWLDENFK